MLLASGHRDPARTCVGARAGACTASCLSTTGVLYTIPSLAAFSLLLPYTGLSHLTAIIPLAAYSLLILVRNIVTGLEQVPARRAGRRGRARVTRAARKLWRVDVPLALPTIIAGIRIAVVTIIGLDPGERAHRAGWARSADDRRLPTATSTRRSSSGIVLTVAFAVAADAFLLGIQKLLTPWTRKGAAVSAL